MLVILNNIDDALCRRRCQGLRSVYDHVNALGFTRNTQQQRQNPVYDVRSLGAFKNGLSWARVVTTLKAWNAIARGLRSDKCVYVTGVDNYLLVLLIRYVERLNIYIVLEIEDIHHYFTAHCLISLILRKIHGILLTQNSTIFVVTSPAFAEKYLLNTLLLRLRKEQVFLLENKVNLALSSRQQKGLPKVSDVLRSRIRIGYFGNIRCTKSLQFLKRLACSSEDYEIILRGVQGNNIELESYVHGVKNMHYKGGYRSPEDLLNMYSEIDLGWIAHAHATANTQMARANRYYECGFFGVPMIAQLGTMDAMMVEQNNMGVVIDLQDMENALNKMLSLTKGQIDTWCKNIKRMPGSQFTVTDDYRLLASWISLNETSDDKKHMV